MKFSVLLIFTFLLLGTTSALAQEENIEFEAFEDIELDSLTILDLIDSLMSISEPKSEISVRVGYLSQVFIAGRDLGIKQKGFNAGVNYFHKSGFWGGLSGFWYSDLDPSYALTNLSVGYMGLVSKKISYMTTYSHSFYNASELATLENTLSATGIFDFGIVEPYIDYSFYFGKENAHRVTPGISFDIYKKNVLIFDKISFRPSISVIFGNQNIVETKFVTTDDERLQIFLNNRPALKRFIKDNPEPTLEQIEKILVFFPNAAFLFETQDTDRNVFGLMNYGFSFPFSFRKGNFNFSATYTYNIPIALPGESYDLSPNDYISFGLSYKFKL